MTKQLANELDLSVDFERFFDNFVAPKKKVDVLLPLYEAVSNSIHAVEDAAQPEGTIEIEFVSSSKGVFNGFDRIVGFKITDTGVGFNDENLNSFKIICSNFKKQRGGKGLGRFSWLIVFDSIVVQSVYRDSDGSFKKRIVNFMKKAEPIADRVEPTTEKISSTTVFLEAIKPEYQNSAQKNASEIAESLFKHFYLTLRKNPTISIFVVDPRENVRVRVGDALDANEQNLTCEINGRAFQVDVVAFPANQGNNRHELWYCADARAVCPATIEDVLPIPAKRPLVDASGNERFLSVYVHSDALDESVNPSRTGFNIPATDSETLIPNSETTFEEINKEVGHKIKNAFPQEFAAISTAKKKRIVAFLHDNPRYYHLGTFAQKELGRLNADATDAELEKAFHAAYLRLDVEQRQSWATLQKLNADGASCEEIQKRYRECLDLVESSKQADLTAYVLKRKTVIEMLDFLLLRRDDQKYQTEDKIHRLIYPMKATSDDEISESNNLWLIDDKLIPYGYIASDKPLKKTPQLASDSSDRPDLIFFNVPMLFAIGDENPLSSIVIVEFKKPMRDGYGDDDNPIDQVRKYAKEIKSCLSKTPQGRTITVSEKVRVYCYIIADLTPSLRDQCEAHLRPTHDQLGFYGNFNEPPAYVEVISYDKLLQDAKKRNQIFFDKLALPKNVIFNQD